MEDQDDDDTAPRRESAAPLDEEAYRERLSEAMARQLIEVGMTDLGGGARTVVV